MTHRTIATFAAIAMAIGGVALSSDTAAAVTSPPDTTNETAELYWDMYGLISEGSMWNPEAFLALNDQAQLAQARAQSGTLEVAERIERIESGEDIAVFVDPTLAAACGIAEPEVRFAFDSAELKDDANGTLETLSACLKKPPLADAYLSITGHTDPRGTEEYNSELGLDRADAVGDALERLGLDGARIDTYSMGERMASDSPAQWPSERRVVIALDR